MKYTVLVAVVVFVAAANARNFERADTDVSDVDPVDNVRRSREHGSEQRRHRRRSWQMNYGYDYPQPPNPYYPDSRRDYQNQQQDLLPQIYRLLDEISTYVRRPPPPPPPPQPIYVPYPVPYPAVQDCKCPPRKTPTTNKPNIESRFPVMEDTNQNWGLVDDKEESYDDEGDGSRPISFTPIVPKTPSKRPPPSLEHGSSQSYSTQSPREAGIQQTMPNRCDVFSLSCCSGNTQERIQCFNNAGCSSTYDNGKGCSQDRLLSVIDAYSKAYSPVN